MIGIFDQGNIRLKQTYVARLRESVHVLAQGTRTICILNYWRERQFSSAPEKRQCGQKLWVEGHAEDTCLHPSAECPLDSYLLLV